MMEKDTLLDIKFNEAVDKVNEYHSPLPADILLRLYAYYKIANKNFENPRSRKPLINAFKTNALFQAKDVTEDEAKQKYIDLVEKYIS
ncbi:acyl-CoA-binding protein [Ascidiimonas sp. W6]|uniref:acyl-CoA-binding protein n=1 Tax=Ascidiimonas meishanensis TaxID=3128903 RepID=UPI0030EC87F3